jgi:hypothetical protein
LGLGFIVIRYYLNKSVIRSPKKVFFASSTNYDTACMGVVADFYRSIVRTGYQKAIMATASQIFIPVYEKPYATCTNKYFTG